MKGAFAAFLLALTVLVDDGQSPVQLRLHGGPAASGLVSQGLLAALPADASGFQAVPPPGLRSVRNDAQATVAPWDVLSLKGCVQ